jgi:inorganic triphosphatase YgiF
MTRASRAILPAAAILGLAVSCGGGGSDLQKARQDLVSWSGTLSIAADQWGRGLDPTPFTRTVSDAARDAVRKTAKTLARGSSAGDAGAAALRDAAQRLDSMRQALDAGIAKRDGPAAVALAGELETLRRSLRSEP